MENHRSVKPKRAEMLSREVLDELLIYDRKNYRGHCLNPAAALVWNACDGNTAVPEITRRLQRLDPGADEQVVYFALRKLKNAGLLVDESLPEMARISRRDLVRRAAGAAVIAIPIVTSMLMPTPAHAVSCLQLGRPCTNSGQCCSGQCGLAGVNLVCI